jgi:hypothetical protein
MLFSGCASVRFGSNFTEDGTATHTLEVTVPRASMTEQDIARVERQIADAEVKARSSGLTTARIDNPDLLGIRVINTTQDATNAGLALNSIFNTLSLNSDSAPVAPFHGTFERVSEAVGGTSFKLELTVDGDLLYVAAANVAPGHPQFSTADGVREVVKIEYVLTMPGEITETNGGLRGEGGVVWTIPLDGPTLLEARSTVGKDTPWIWTTLAIVIAFAVIVATTAIVWKLLAMRHRSGGPSRRLTVDPRLSAERQDAFHSLMEIRESLAMLIKRAVRGEPLDPRQPRATRMQQNAEDLSRGVDAEGD